VPHGNPLPVRLVKPEEADLAAKQAARMARLITSGDGTSLHLEPTRSTSGELPSHLVGGTPGRQNSLEFLPVLPPMHVHSHPVTTGQGPPVRGPTLIHASAPPFNSGFSRNMARKLCKLGIASCKGCV
jgi:hypothetical protein